MAHTADLYKAGMEGFALLDGKANRPYKPPVHYPQPQQGIQNSPRNEVIDSYEVARRHGGVWIVEFRNRKPLRKPY